MNTPGITEVLYSLILVGISLGVVRWWRIPLEKEIALGSIRSFVQLVAVGYAIEFIFGMESPWLVMLALMIMLLVGSFTASSRVRKVDGALLLTFIAMSAGSLFTLAVMLVTDIITLEARYVIPLAGMLIGNSMNATALTIERLASDIGNNKLRIETALALGKPWRAATMQFQRDAVHAGMISMLNAMKTVGIVALPGAMTGMILAGASPLDAVLLQVIVMYMLISAVTVSSVVAVELTVRGYFTAAHQLKSSVRQNSG